MTEDEWFYGPSIDDFSDEDIENMTGSTKDEIEQEQEKENEKYD